MTISDPLLQWTDGARACPLSDALIAARTDVLAAIHTLATVPDSALEKPWPWTGGGGETDVRYGFYRISEALERAGIDAAAAGVERGRGAQLIGPATAARWDLQGVLIQLPDVAWDADPGGGEWSVRRTIGHVVTSQRGYALATSWWAAQGSVAGAPDLADAVPDEVWTHLPEEEDAAPGTPADVRANLDDAVDHAAERLAGLSADELEAGARWSGFPVDVAFRQSRWASHLREHTVQVEKTLVMIGHTPTEVDRLVRLILAAWGRAESAVYGASGADAAVAILAAAARSARDTADQLTQS